MLAHLVLGAGVVALMRTVQGLNSTRDELEYYRLSSRFWTVLALLGIALPTILLLPLAAWGMFENVASLTAVILAMLPPGILIGVGALNAGSFRAVAHRRQLALSASKKEELIGVVVDRTLAPFRRDLMTFTVELRRPRAQTIGGYRPHEPEPVEVWTIQEHCPASEWDRFAPGRKVQVVLDQADPSVYAVLIFDYPALEAEPESASELDPTKSIA